MTRYPPQSQEGYQNSQEYDYPPQQGGNAPPGSEQYGSQQPPSYGPYGNYNPGEDYYAQRPPRPPPQKHGGEYDRSAQSYYASNAQAYQGPNQSNYNAPPYQSEGYQHSSPPQQYQNYGSDSGYPPYGQQYPRQGGEVDNFRAHFDQPQGPPSSNQDPYGTYPPQQSAEDRGLMGALAGGAAGGFAGHKVHHGLLGGIGGAIAGSMLEDAYKKKHKKEKTPKSRRGSNSSNSSSDSSDDDDDKKHRRHGREAGGGGGEGGVMAGNFRASARDVRLEGHSNLVAEVADVHGHHQWSSIDLNDCFTNENGVLKWARGGNFAATARHIRLENEGTVLEAELGDGRGGWQHNRVYLNERITNDNGRLVMM